MSSENSSSSSSYTTVQQIINYFVNLCSDGNYKVINSYNNADEIDLNGVIAVSLSNMQVLHNGDSDDYKITVTISGQFLIAEDITQSKTYQMFDYIISKLDEDSIKANFSDMAGLLKNGGSVSSDGQYNTCGYSIDLYFCKD